MTTYERFLSFFTKRGQRLDLMKQMLHITGAMGGLDKRQCGDNDLRSAVVACLRCPHADACTEWASVAKTPSLPPDFCWNAARLRRITAL